MTDPAARWADACAAAALVSRSIPLLLRAKPGPVRDALLARLGEVVRLPATIEPAALEGGIDVLASVAAGRPVERAGLLATLGARVLVVMGAERIDTEAAARLASWIDRGSAAVVLVDEGSEGDLPPMLAARAAMRVDLEPLSIRDLAAPEAGAPGEPRTLDDAVVALTEAAAALGIGSIRAPIDALRVARASASARGPLCEADLTLAARLVLAPLATTLPPEEMEDASPPETVPDTAEGTDLKDKVVDAVRAVLPPALLERAATRAGRGGGSATAKRGVAARGRPGRIRAGLPVRGARLDLAATLLAAAPFQRLRGRDGGMAAIRRDDLRIRLPRPVSRGLTIFAVDASGSAALARLAEVKGAVEGLLATSYVRRDEVALIAFRGEAAETLLPPTRSLARARRELAALPGGGATPLAAGIVAGLEQALRARAAGRAPRLLLLTDGGANVARDGTRARGPAEADAMAAAALVARAGIAATVVDTSRRGAAGVKSLAAAMGAEHVALPRLDEASLGRIARE